MEQRRILVIDDEPKLVELLKMRLEASNYYVLTASDGIEGIQKAKNENPDLIILDILMPNKDGYTFIKEMKADEILRKIPVIVLTAREGVKDLFAMEGIKDYIVKPFETQDLLDKISKYFV